MKKKEKQYQEFILKCIKKYQPILQLGHFTIVVKKDTGSQYYMACQHTYPYNDGIIIYSDDSLKDWLEEPRERHEKKVVHEMCHLITDPLYTKATTMWNSKSEIEDERERLTDHIAVMVTKLVNE